MLSRVAERMYWFGRYLERIENTTRLINVSANLVIDLPQAKYIWASLISITGYEERFAERFTIRDEKNVVKFLLDGEACSITTSISLARENARTTREIMPNETWEKVNKLHMYVGRNIESAQKRDGRHQFLKEVLSICQEINGYLAGSMSLDDAYNFMKLGMDLERADMTTRILDVGCFNLMNPDHVELHEYESILWVNVLQSLTAYQMYRQHVDDRVNGEDVAEYLLKDQDFPRTVTHCLTDVQEAFEQLPNHDEPLRSVTHAQRTLAQADIPKLLAEGEMHTFIDEIQAELGDIHRQVAANWFMGHREVAEG